MNKSLIIIPLVLVALIGGGFFLYKYEKKSLPGSMVGQDQTQNTSSNSSSGLSAADTTTVAPVEEIHLTILSPTDGSTLTSPSIKVSGITGPNADVFVNDTETRANSNGNFSVNLVLDEGDNTISVMANDNNGNYADKEITVTYAAQ